MTYTVLVLPFEHSLGFPQKNFVSIFGVMFTFKYKINSYDDSVVIQIKVSSDQSVLFQGKLVEGYNIGVEDPTYGRAVMYLMPIHLDRNNMEIEFVIPYLNPDYEEDYVD